MGLAQPLAAAQGVDLNVVDPRAARRGRSDRTGRFYLVMVCTIVGYLDDHRALQVARACDCVSSSVCWE